MKLIDAHIHLDWYKDQEIELILDHSEEIAALISVSFDFESCKRNLQLAKKYTMVKPAFGFHPEQNLPSEQELTMLLDWMDQNRAEMVAVGEVGLPYFLRCEQKITSQEYSKYIELLELFVRLAKKWDKPINLHAIYDDAPIVCDLLEKNSIQKAHFHWFKGDEKTVSRMIENGYFISFTPEIAYEGDIHPLIQRYPLEQIMIETDGPWPFEGPFSGQMTHPNMMKESIIQIAKIKNLSITEVKERIYANTHNFYMK